MTEDEAKTRYCPAAASPDYGIREFKCVGSSCMAWRWLPSRFETMLVKRDDKPDPNGGWRYVVTYDDGLSKYERAASDAPVTEGYCGLAGSPNA